MIFDRVYVVYSRFVEKTEFDFVSRTDEYVEGIYRTLKGAKKYVASRVDHIYSENVKWREMVDVYYSPNRPTRWSTQAFDTRLNSYIIREMEVEE